MKKTLVILFSILPALSFGLTVEEAVDIALHNHPYIKQEEHLLLSKKYDYLSTYSLFFPRVEFTYRYTDYQDTYLGDYFSMRYSITFRWKVFNSGRNILTNKQKKALYLSQREQFEEGKIQTVYKVKKAYYTA
ncbi:MAG: TolC family protein, partial [Aquificae bacterium]|nr:TolC family protein [Aquificota bacterium]